LKFEICSFEIYPMLFTPLTLRSVTLKNRIAVSPMCQYSSVDGFANDWHLVHLGSRAAGGAGLVIQEATAVSPEGRITPDDMGLWKEEHIPVLQRITSFIKQQGSVPGIQLAHAGRKASHQSPWKGNRQIRIEDGGWQAVAPSAISFREGTEAPVAMDDAAIKKLVDDFTQAAERALRAGFEVVEIHAAHGYLLHSFLSPLSNQRTDAYGGTFENRCRLLLEVTRSVRKVWADKPLFVRISATDWVAGGWDLQDSVRLARQLKNEGVDLIDCSTGGNTPRAEIPVGPLYQVPFAEAIRKEAGIATGAVGMITTAEEAESILQEGKANLVLLARQFLRDPYFPFHAAKALKFDMEWPVQYERGK
jgi:2,4-dienoyl-CoA reductase-like NADH-dependent reductase (Old Yellow Enzyme family)